MPIYNAPVEEMMFLFDHLKDNKNDHSSRMGLLRLVGKRRKLLNYLSSKHIERYRDIIAKLDIRK